MLQLDKVLTEAADLILTEEKTAEEKSGEIVSQHLLSQLMVPTGCWHMIMQIIILRHISNVSISGM